MSKIYLGVDIGGTAVKLGLVDETGRVLARAERSVSFDGYKTPILDTVTAAIREFLAPHDAPALAGIGVSATGWWPEPAATFRAGSAWISKARWNVRLACP